MTKFNIVINSFAGRILISARVNKMSCEEVLEWNGDNDWWHSFEMNGRIFDFHLLYEDELSINIYPAPEDGQTNYPESCKTIFKLTDKNEF